MLRPVPARWFEVLVAHDDVAAALAALAATGAIELEVRAQQGMSARLTELKPLLDAYSEFAGRYQAYWSPPRGSVPGTQLPAREVLERGLKRIAAWREQADPVIRSLQDLELEQADLLIWREIFTRFQWSPIEFGLLRRADSILARRLYVFPPDVALPVPENVVAQRFTLQNQVCVLVLGPPAVVADLDRQTTALKGRRSGLGIPDWLDGKADDNLPRVAQRLTQVEADLQSLRATLNDINRVHELGRTLADIERLRWFAGHVRQLSGTECFAWLTGWTSDLRGRRLGSALARARARALLRFPAPPAAAPPLILRNPWWARPFELFARAIGVPSQHEIDPSPLLAVIVPLLFGYMFGDVGQGLVLLAAGIVLRRRLVVARLLIAGGASAMVFGVLFGSVFAREDWLPALWLHPLSEPLIALGWPLAAGALLLALGLALNGVEAYWRGELKRWLQADAGILLFYLGMMGAVVQLSLLWVGIAGLIWFVIGCAWREHRMGAVFAGVGGAIEHAFQLAVNTLSFVRVGAFALGHAGLSAAVVALAEASRHAAVAALVMVLGNLVVIVLEGLVVSIQTTRLVLFEFFIRFLRGEGRVFRPLAGPPPHVHGGSNEKPA